jgi:hypothetical protein
MSKYERESDFETRIIVVAVLNPNIDAAAVMPQDEGYSSEEKIQRAYAYIRNKCGIIAPVPKAVASPARLSPGRNMRAAPSASQQWRGQRAVEVVQHDELQAWLDAKRTIGIQDSIAEFWGGIRTVYPHLYALVEDFLAMPLSAAEIERFLSQIHPVLPYFMGASDSATIAERFFLHANRDITERVMEKNPHACPHGR